MASLSLSPSALWMLRWEKAWPDKLYRDANALVNKKKRCGCFYHEKSLLSRDISLVDLCKKKTGTSFLGISWKHKTQPPIIIKIIVCQGTVKRRCR